MTKTENYGLNQWNAADRVLMSDFNEDNAKIDAALDSLAVAISTCGNMHMEIGTYTGTGLYGSSSKSTSIKLSQKPLLMFIAGGGYISIAAEGSNKAFSASDSSIREMTVTWNDSGSISWYSGASVAHQMNTSSTVYTYYAIYL